MKSLLEKPRPGQFKAVCRRGITRYVSRMELPEDIRNALMIVTAEIVYQGKTPEQVAADRAERAQASKVVPPYNAKHHGYPVIEHCDFETTDRDLYAAHMKDVHDGGLHRWDNGSLDANVRTVRNYSPRMPIPVKPWRAPRLTEDGTDFDVSKADGLMVRCECGLYAQLNGSQADELWWREHVSMCAEKSAVA